MGLEIKLLIYSSISEEFDALRPVKLFIFCFSSLINGGVYRAGFATTQEAYDASVNKLFEGLEKVSPM